MIEKHKKELENISLFNEPNVIKGYADWNILSKAESLILEFAIKENYSVIDIGCGAGRHCSFLQSKNVNYIGIDISEPLLTIAKQKFPHLEFRNYDAYNLTTEFGRFDCAIYMHNGLDVFFPMKNREQIVRNIKSILKPTGVFIFSTHIPDWYHTHSKMHNETNRMISRIWKRITRSQGGYLSENYRGKKIWQYRASAEEVQKQMAKLGFIVEAIFPDLSKSPSDWNYYLATIKDH